uniref:SH3 domain-containing protein n=1 Tax=Ectobacillus panaciterrae TaxID=363872 RepID=UPI0009D6F2EA
FNGKEAFVSLEFLRFNASAPNPQPPTNNNSSVAAETGTINADRLNVRASASAQGAVLGKLNQGQSVSILSKDNGWAKILFNGKEAFVSLAFLQLAKPTSVGNEAPSANHSETGLVNVNLLNIRASASGQANILGKLKQGQSVSVLSKSNGWAKILFNEKEAYVSLEFLRFNTAPTDTPQNSQLKQTVTVPQATVQEGASYSSKSIGTVNKGAEVSVISKDGDWIKILYNNKEGFIPSLAVQTLTQEETTIVTASALNVRSAPSTSGSLVGKLNKGQTVSIISKVNGWAKIIFNGKEAYVSLGYLDTNTSTVSYSVITSSHTILQPHKKEAEAAFAALQEDGYLTRNGKIINMKNGFVRTNKLANIYDSNTNQKLTYVAPNTDLKFVKTVGSLVYVTLDGQNGYVTLEDVTLYPNMLHAATSYYTVKSGNIIYNSYDSSTNSYYTFNEGYAPAHLSAGIQYEAFDRTSIGGQDSYQYFEYLPLRVPASYTAAELDAFIKANRPDSPLIGTGQYFIEAANKQHINVSYLLAHALIESGWGTSRIAKEKHNLFGFQAVDSNPYGGAASFATLQQGIEFCAQYINKNYLTPGSQFYNGAFIGDKARGMNVLYASDSSWARGIASLMHKLDTMYRDRNHQAYQLSKISAGVTLLQNLGGQKAGVTSREIIVAIKGSVQTPQGLYYEVFSDNPQYNSVFINAKDIKLIQAY